VSFFLVFLAIALIGVAILLGTGTASKVFRGRPRAGGERHERGHRPFADGFDEPVANLPPVLLPARPEPSDVDRLRFGIGLRGYRMDQVDQVLDELRDQLAARDRTVAELEGELERLRAAPEQAVE
jgi:DivIVA domain-containing protein